MKRAAEPQVADLSGIVGQLRVTVESDASIRNSNVSISYGVAFESLDNNVQAFSRKDKSKVVWVISGIRPKRALVLYWGFFLDLKWVTLKPV